jgi:peptidyl-prolyl cis-trans isomerase C
LAVATPVARVLLPAAILAALAGCSRPAGGPAASPSAAALDPARPLPSPVPDVVARVNGEPIRLHQVLPMAKAELDRVPAAQRDEKKPELVRRALQQYIDRELLLQEALARGIEADTAAVEWDYDQLRGEHPDESAWRDFLAKQGMDPQSLRAELRARHTVIALVEQELKQAAAGEADPAVRPQNQAEVERALVARLRAEARIELFL